MACSGNGYEKTGNGIIVNVEQQQPTDVRKVKVEVVGEIRRTSAWKKVKMPFQ